MTDTTTTPATTTPAIPTADAEKRPYGIGRPVARREDARHLHGRGSFVADLELPGLHEVAFVRSQVAHGRVRAVRVPDGAGDRVWTARELAAHAEPLTATSTLPGFRSAPLPNLAADKVRYVGEPLALAVGESRARAEDLAAAVIVEIDELEPVPDFRTALAGRSLVHDEWPDNVFATTAGDLGSYDAAADAAHVSVTREYTMNRQAVVPLETRGVAAYYDRTDDLLTVWSSTQTPHMVRDMVALQLGLDARRVRVVAPEMGGGFGTKCSVYPEEITLAAVAMQLGHPVRWIEDRWEAMVSSTHARDHFYRITAHADAEGTILGVEADIVVDGGAYSVHPWTATMDATMAAGMIPGPYRIRNYRYRTRSVASNKTPSGPYRGVARPGACFAIERTLDDLAHELGIEPHVMRVRNMVTPEEMPYLSVMNKVYDSGDYAEAVRRTAALIGHDAWRDRQREVRAVDSGHRIGIGYGAFTEQTAHGCIEWASRGLALTIGTEGARLEMDATGAFTLSVGIKSHGQSLETTLAQVVSEVFDIEPDQVRVQHGDTSRTPRGDGTFASRSMVMSGGATHGAATKLAEKVCRIGAVLLGCEPGEVELSRGAVHGPTGTLAYADLAREFLFTPDHVPGVDAGLEVTHFYRSEVQTGAFTYATHAVVVDVDIDTGVVSLLDYAIVEDCGTIVNPHVVDGQLVGGIAQGIGTAMLEELIYDTDGQPKSTSFLDYLLPGASEVPEIKIGHIETPSPYTEFGMKGAGEGGAIAPPAAIANAVTDALRDIGATIDETPMTPVRVWTAIEDATKPRPEKEIR